MKFLRFLLPILLVAGGIARAAQDLKSPTVARQVSDAIADTVADVLPAVVVIRTEATQLYLDQWRGRIFKAQEPMGQGSGVIIRADGYVLTSNHVIDGAEKVEVVLDDGRSYTAEVVGANKSTDIAVLRIRPAKGEVLRAIPRGDSDKVRVGEICIAIGSPFSLNSTVTQGIVSQKGRSTDFLPVVDFLQTSAPINPGNSGGPLVDVDGRLIGINTFIQTGGPYSQGSIGLGFAVPSNTALRIADLIINGGSGELPYVGIEMQPSNYGLVITRVLGGSPAEKAGLRSGDILQKVDGKAIRMPDEIRSLVVLKKPGDRIPVEYVRRSRTGEVTERRGEVVVERMPVIRQEMD